MTSYLAAARDKLASLRDAYHRSKYKLTGRLVGRSGPAAADVSERGLLCIQLDALPYETFCAAMERGYLPFLRKQLLRGEFALTKWYSGVPSNTPSVQAAIMYGRNDNIPGFRWYEKEGDLHINFKNPLSAGIVEGRLNGHGTPGLLSGGSSYSNVFSGGAATAVATLGSFTSLNIAQRLRWLHLMALILINLFTVVRTLAFTVWEACLEIYDWVVAIKHRIIQRSEYLFPLYRILLNVWVREVITIGALTDIARGTPVVYVTYLSYDELAHQRGPFSKSALASLRTIDHRIKRIVRLARRGIVRDYDVLIFSDHGTTASMPFYYLYGQTLEQFVSGLVKTKVKDREPEPPGEAQITYARVFALRFAAYEREFKRGLRWVVRGFGRILTRRVRKTPETLSGGEGVVVAVSGPLGHIYLPMEGQPRESAIDRAYPGLIRGLVRHTGIGVVVTRGEDGVVVRSRHGAAVIDASGERRRKHGEPLPRIEPKNLAYRGLAKLMNMTNSGDIVVLGADHGRYVVNLEEQMAAHGGLGNLQNSAFLMHQPEHRAFRDIDDPLKLHEILACLRFPPRCETAAPAEGVAAAQQEG